MKQTGTNLASRGLIKNIMAGCIAMILKHLLDGNAHSIPAWERARIQRLYVCKTDKTTQLWDRDFMGAPLARAHTMPMGIYVLCGFVCGRVGGAALKSTPMSIGCR
jgi:hypothetical protein